MTENRTCLPNFVKTVHFNMYIHKENKPSCLGTDYQVTDRQTSHPRHASLLLCTELLNCDNFQGQYCTNYSRRQPTRNAHTEHSQYVLVAIHTNFSTEQLTITCSLLYRSDPECVQG